ncbi:hypothetical protein NLI96_g784 [Meripilus lineatus]|uniref:Fungal-type protein kinase domain-containing protein n=1 Tax=Meripilus lineatus TaxID=2056292 RepID=A0AAD5VE55_9APHY|nr:hypothetical protein NLI96_g784 [Physisporinus lineatus]
MKQRRRNADPSLNFIANHLNLFGDDIFGRDGDQELVNVIKSAKTKSRDFRLALMKLLNRYSKRAHNHTQVAKHPFIFIPTALTRHSDASLNEIIMIPGPDDVLEGTKRQVDFHDIVSIVMCGRDDSMGIQEVAQFSRYLLKSQPDMAGTYGLSANLDYYQILWSDASGGIASPLYDWTKLAPLAAYVCSIYVPPRHHVLLDSSITREINPWTERGMTWSIKNRRAVTYTGCKLLYSGDAWGRRTYVWKHTDDQGQITIIKDAFHTISDQRLKSDLLSYSHRNGIYPGVVRFLFIGNQAPSPSLKTAPPSNGIQFRDSVKERIRLEMGSYGASLWEARSVKDVLMAIFDILEVHRGLCMEMGVLHRNISPWNIVMYPAHHPDTMKDKELTKNPPLFISQILSRDKSNNGEDKASALLIDFDNAVKMTPDLGEKDMGKRTPPTGTSMFVSRTVSLGSLRICESAKKYLRMPVLEGEVKELYEFAYGAETYDRYCDTPDTIHGVKPVTEKELDRMLIGYTDRPARHKPHHDAESIFWVLLYVLIHAQPLERSPEANLKRFWTVRSWFHSQTIGARKTIDARFPFFHHQSRPKFIRSYLDPKLAPLAGLISQLLIHINPEYDLFETPPPPEHLHEAMRRLLLKFIHSMKDPIALDPRASRPLEHDDPSMEGQNGWWRHLEASEPRMDDVSLKRKRDDTDLMRNPPKRMRTGRMIVFKR